MILKNYRGYDLLMDERPKGVVARSIKTGQFITCRDGNPRLFRGCHRAEWYIDRIAEAPSDPAVTFFQHDSSVNITTPGGGKRRDIYEKVIRFLRERGFKVCTDPDTKKHHRCIAKDFHYGKKGDLEFKAHYYPNGHEIKFFQNVVFENQNGGQYDFDKLQKMPYLLRKRFEAERNHLFRFYQGLGFSEKSEPVFTLAIDKIMQRRKSLAAFHKGHYDKPPADYNSKDRDGQILEDGQLKYFRDYSGRLCRGVIYYNINNMWWVHVNKYHYTNVASFYFFDCLDPRKEPRVTDQKRIKRLAAVKEQAVKNEHFEKAAVLRDILKAMEQPQAA